MTISSDHVLEAIDQIGAVRSQTEKARLLKAALAHPLFRRAVLAAVNPFITYGMQDMPPVSGAHGDEPFGQGTWDLLDALAARKLTGHAAQSLVAAHLQKLTPNSRQLLQRIIQKDLRAGFSETLVNKVEPGLVPTFTCMRGQSYSLPALTRLAKKHGRPTFPLDADIKYDGIRTLFVVDVAASLGESTAEAVSRNGLPLPAMQWLSLSALALAARARVQLFPEHTKFVVDCEGVEGDGMVFEETSSSVKKKSVDAKNASLRVIDIIPWAWFTGQEKGEKQEWRKAALRSLLEKEPLAGMQAAESFTVNSHEELVDLYNEALDKGHEGLIVKPYFGIYEPKKSPYWLKLKLEETFDLQVVGVYEGEGQFAGSLGGVVVDFKGVEVRVGGGFSPAERAQLWADHAQVTVPWTVVDPEHGEVVTYYATPTDRPVVDRVFEVLCNGVTRAGSLRHPRFVKERRDLRPEEVEGNK